MKAIEEIKWWHQVPLKDGRMTPGQVPVHLLEDEYLFSQIDFTGRSVLDIGCWDGYFSFRAERRGARRVVGLDDPAYRWGGLDGFHFLHEHFQSSVEWRQGTVYSLPDERFDIVLCYGVLYHLSDPLAAAINCFQVANEMVAIEGLIFQSKTPLLWLLEAGFRNDDSVVYAMSTAYLEMVARMCGFELVTHRQSHSERGAMLFRCVEKTRPSYKPTCFPIPPA